MRGFAWTLLLVLLHLATSSSPSTPASVLSSSLPRGKKFSEGVSRDATAHAESEGAAVLHSLLPAFLEMDSKAVKENKEAAGFEMENENGDGQAKTSRKWLDLGRAHESGNLMRFREKIKMHKAKHKAKAKAKHKVKGITNAVKKLMGWRRPQPEDIEDCDVGETKMEEDIYDSFVKNCIEAQKAPIFQPVCSDMFMSIDDMVMDYVNDFTVNQMCEANKMCR